MYPRRTKIVATLGPATDDADVLAQVIEAGANVLRINFSHGSGPKQAARVQQVREIAKRVDHEVAVLADLAGPKIRIERFADGQVQLEPGDIFTLDVSDEVKPGDNTRVNVSYSGLPQDVAVNDLLLLDDGLIAMRVIGVEGDAVRCEVTAGGILKDRKGLNLRGGGLSVPGIAEHDYAHIQYAAELRVDYLAVSFPRNAADIHQARKLLREAGSQAGVIAKIERTEALENLESIIDASDAVLVARGDLGVEIGDAALPGIQKEIIRTALKQNRVVITATQMMESMIENPIPTRAEVLDVANAVIDGSDAVMLSAETAVGKHPRLVIEAMHRVCLGAERHCAEQTPAEKLNVRFRRIDQAIAMAAMFTATNVDVQAIIALTESGATAQWLSRVRSHVPIYALSPNRSSRQRMALYRDVYPVTFSADTESIRDVESAAIQRVWDKGLLKAGDRVIVTMGDKMGLRGGTNTMMLVQIGEDGELDHQSTLDYH